MDFEVNREDFRLTQVVDQPSAELRPGEIRLAIERFALTSNNISYALSGDLLGYWDFFPTSPPWGRVPAMGLGSVVESANADIEIGGRYFGFYPMSEHLVIEAQASRSGFRDIGTHRSGHAAVYTSFTEVSTDPTFRPERADEYLLLRGLFMTSFLVDDFLADQDFYGARQTLVTSASSKTSIALATCLASRGQSSVGLTSQTNREFVEELGMYDEVLTYDEIETLDPATPSVLVDIAGNTDVREAIHHHFGDALRYSSRVGATHWEKAGSDTEDLPGPTTEFFFAPSQVAKRTKEWGAGELSGRIGAALSDFLDAAPQWLTVERSAGPEAVTEAFSQVLEGRSDPASGHILSMSPRAFRT